MRIQEGGVCANCYWCLVSTREIARAFICHRCEQAAVECTTCVRIGQERELAGAELCATCAIEAETTEMSQAEGDTRSRSRSRRGEER